MSNLKGASALAILLSLVAVIGIVPIFTIWSLNTLFHTEIPYTFATWCAVVWLITLLHGIKITIQQNN